MKLILFGAPGVGKGTQSKLLAQEFSIPQISTGDIFRRAIENKTELGKQAKDFLDKGILVPDLVVLGMVKERLKEEDTKKGFILDGFPRTIPQAEGLEKMLMEIGSRLDKVVEIRVPTEELNKRLVNRRLCRTCGEEYNLIYKPIPENGICVKCSGKEFYHRSDDSEEVVFKRNSEYEKNTFPLIEFYKNNKLLLSVDGVKPIEEVNKDILNLLKG
ncbi:adenylate kinase [bacterium]|nr:adenylate kinase [bacterium]